MKFMKYVALAIGLVFISAHSVENQWENDESDTPNGDRPNIILIFLDDVSATEFNFYNGPGINTPTLDMMASQGVTIKTAYSQALCGPSRAALITGKYAHQNGHYGNSTIPSSSMYNVHYTLGNVMKDAGYKTAWFGKQHIDRSFNPSDLGYDYYVINKYWDGYDGPDQLRPEQDQTNRTGMYGIEWYWHPGILANGQGVPTTPNDFGPDIELDSLLSFVEQSGNCPYFIYWPTNLPHSQYNTEDNIWERPETPVYDASGNMTGARNPGTMQSNLEFVDFAVEKLIDKLTAEQQMDNTIILIMGDNGTAPTGKGKTESEIALHVPLVIYGPGLIQPSGYSDVLIDLTDFMPTFLDLAGGSVDNLQSVDGESFAPYLLGNPFVGREWISAQLDEARWLRTREWLLDGNGDLWFCGTEYDERNYQLVTPSDSLYASKKAELQLILDQNIPELN